MKSGDVLPALLLTLCACQVTTDPYGRTVMSTPTLEQVLDGAAQQPSGPQRWAHAYDPIPAPPPFGDRRTVRGHVVQIMQAGLTDHAVLVDGRLVVHDATSEFVTIQGVYEGGGRAYALIAESAGGNACAATYQAVDLSGPAPAVSPRFGNCNDAPRVRVVSGALRVSFPPFKIGGPETDVYKDGRLRTGG